MTLTSTFYTSASSGEMFIAKHGEISNLETAATTPASFLSSLRFHTAFTFLKIIGNASTSSLTFPAFNRDTNTFGGSKCSSSTTVAVPTLEVQTQQVGSYTGGTPALMFMELNGTFHQDRLKIESVGNYIRFIFPTYNSSSQKIFLTSLGFAYGSNVPAQSFSNVVVHIGG